MCLKRAGEPFWEVSWSSGLVWRGCALGRVDAMGGRLSKVGTWGGMFLWVWGFHLRDLGVWVCGLGKGKGLCELHCCASGLSVWMMSLRKSLEGIGRPLGGEA